MKKWIAAAVCVFAVAAFLGPWAFCQWQVGSAMAKLKDANAPADVHRLAGCELVELGPAAIPALTELLKNKDRDVRGRAADAVLIMRELVPEETIDELIRILTDQLRLGDFETRRKAADSLQMMSRPLPKETIDALMQAANNEQELQLRYDSVSKPYSALVNLGQPAVPALTQALKSDNADIRLQAMQGLARIGPEADEAVPALVDVLKNRKLTKAQSKLDKADWMISSDAAVALASIGTSAIPALADALKDRRDYVRFDAGSALSRIGAPAVNALVEALRDEQPVVRLEAVQALERIGPPAKRAVPSLIAALKEGDSPTHLVSIYVARALGKIGFEQAVPALVQMLEDEDVHARTHAAEALYHLGWNEPQRLLEVLIDALDHDTAIVCSARTLEQIGPDAKRAVPKLRELSENDDIDADFRSAVSRALLNIQPSSGKH